MKESKENPRLPIGGTAELNAKKETLPAVEVKNHVLWVNPDFPELPLRLPTAEELKRATENGKTISTKFALFLTPAPGEKEKTFSLEVAPLHGRSGILGRVIFKDREGNLYRDIDIKGGGYSCIDSIDDKDFNNRKLGLCVGPVKRRYSDGSLGIVESDRAFWDRDMSEKFLKAGIRVPRTIAIIALEEIVDWNGGKIPVEEAARQGAIIEPMSRPVLEIRAFGTKSRLEDVSGGESYEQMARDENRRRLMLKDARQLVAKELGKTPESFSWEEYFEWLAETVGRNVGLMHKNGWCHHYLSAGHNITLDGRLVDLDSVVEEGDEKYDEEYDQESMQKALKEFFYQSATILGLIDLEFGDLEEIADSAYLSARVSVSREKLDE